MNKLKQLLLWIECKSRHIFCRDFESRLNRIEEKLDYISSLIKVTNDIKNLPKAHGQLRLLQLSSLAFSREIISFLDGHGIEYWLGSGALIGAIRHGGFVPWDDDIDLCTTRANYNRLGDLLQGEFCRADVLVTQSDCIRIIKKGTPCQIDIFAWDEFGIDDVSPRSIDSVRILWNQLYAKVVYDEKKLKTNHTLLVSPSNDEIKRLAGEYGKQFSGDHKMIIEGFEISRHWFNCWSRDVIFPLAEIEFEGVKFKCPNKPEKALSLQFGDYMNFPGTFHQHEDILSGIKGQEDEMCRLINNIGISNDAALSL